MIIHSRRARNYATLGFVISKLFVKVLVDELAANKDKITKKAISEKLNCMFNKYDIEKLQPNYVSSKR